MVMAASAVRTGRPRLGACDRYNRVCRPEDAGCALLRSRSSMTGSEPLRTLSFRDFWFPEGARISAAMADSSKTDVPDNANQGASIPMGAATAASGACGGGAGRA